MARKVNHSLLNRAKASKKNEFYTLYPDIERELKHYTSHFRDKVIYCNCDDARTSNFYRYFADNFKAATRNMMLICSTLQLNTASAMSTQAVKT